MALNDLYTNLDKPSAYSGVANLYKEAKKSGHKRKDVEKYLESNRTYTLHKQRREKFERAKTVGAGFCTDIQADLADFQSLASTNKKNKYLLVCVCVLSRKLFLEPIITKGLSDMKEAFTKIFNRMPLTPHRIFSDRGLEFESKTMKKFFKERGIVKTCSSDSAVKAGIAERFIRTIKSRIYRYMSDKGTTDWVSIIQKVENGLNNTVCRATNMKPNSVNFENAQKLWEKLYGDVFKKKFKKPRFSVGDTVRIARKKHLFERGWHSNYTDEIFTIVSIKQENVNMYILKDDDGEEIVGYFYEPELVKVKIDSETVHRIEKVGQNRIINGEKEYYVKFFGDRKFYWIPEKDFV